MGRRARNWSAAPFTRLARDTGTRSSSNALRYTVGNAPAIGS